MGCFSKFSPESIKNEYYTDLLTHLEEDIWVEGTRVHFIYANKMGEKYLKRYKRYFRDPDIREFDMQHEQWLFGGEKYAGPVLKAIDEFMEMPVSGTTVKKGVHRRTVYNPSVQYKMVRGLFKMLGVNKMLDKEGAEFEKLLEDSRKKQEKPLKIPYKKMTGFDIDTDLIDGTTCYTVRVKGAVPKKAVLYLFGGGYILPPDPGDIILCGQIAEKCDAEVWFPLYPMAPEYRLVETLQSTLKVYQRMLDTYEAENIRFFGTSSGGGQAMSLCVFIREEHPEVPLPGKLVLQSPGLQVPPSEEQKGEMERRKRYDVMIPPRFFDRIAPVLATGEEAYLLSPVLYDLTGFPAMEVFYGTREVMIADLPDLKRACLRYGVPLTVHIGKGMMHCWGAMEFVPEAKKVREAYYGALK